MLKSILTTLLVLVATSMTCAQTSITSPYVGEESNPVKYLSTKDIELLQAGSGMALGGLAKSAELNGYPGPRHVLDAHKEGQFNLSNEQEERIQNLFESMQQEAISHGTALIEAEETLDRMFQEKEISEENLKSQLEILSSIQAQLRGVHLSAHLSMMEILTDEQIQRYQEVRGYSTSSNPCDTVPEGHNAEMWRKHNGCNQ